MKLKKQNLIIPCMALGLVLSVLILYYFFSLSQKTQQTAVTHSLGQENYSILQELSPGQEQLRQWIENKEFEKAHAFLDTKLQENPQNILWIQFKTNLLAKEKNSEEALNWLEKKLDLQKNEEKMLYLWMNWSLAQWPRIAASNLLDKNPDEVQLKKALQALWDKNIEESLKQFRSMKKSPLYFEAWVEDMKKIETETSIIQGNKESYQMAKILQSLNQHQSTALSRILGPSFIEKYPDYRDLWTLAGQASILESEWDLAIQQFTESLKIDATNPIASYYLGLAFLQKGIYDKAIEALEISLLYGFEFPDQVYPEIAKSHYHLGNHEEALKSYEYALKQSSQSAEDFHLAVWLALEKVQDKDRAKELIALCSKRHPKEALTYQFEAILALKNKDEALASTKIQKALQLEPNLAEAHVSAGILLEMQNQKEQALWEYETALKLAKPGSLAAQEARTRIDSIKNAPLNP